MRAAFAILLTFLMVFAPVGQTVAAPQEDGCAMLSCATCRCCVQPGAPLSNNSAPLTTTNSSQALTQALPFEQTLVVWTLSAADQADLPAFSSVSVTAVPLFQRDCSYLL
jgi:hypothetical protein